MILKKSSNPFSKGLLWGVGTDGADVISGSPMSFFGSTGMVAGGIVPNVGQGYLTSDFVGGASWPLTNEFIRRFNENGGDCTFAIWANITVLGSYSVLLGIPYNNTGWSSPYSIELGRVASNSYAQFAYNVGGGGQSANSNNYYIQTGCYHFGVTRKADVINFYLNGALHTNNPGNAAGTMAFGTGRTICVFNHSSYSPGEPTGGTASVSLIYNRALSAGEMAAIYTDPRRPFRVNRNPVTFYSAAAGALAAFAAAIDAIRQSASLSATAPPSSSTAFSSPVAPLALTTTLTVAAPPSSSTTFTSSAAPLTFAGSLTVAAPPSSSTAFSSPVAPLALAGSVTVAAAGSSSAAFSSSVATLALTGSATDPPPPSSSAAFSSSVASESLAASLTVTGSGGSSVTFSAAVGVAPTTVVLTSTLSPGIVEALVAFCLADPTISTFFKSIVYGPADRDVGRPFLSITKAATSRRKTFRQGANVERVAINLVAVADSTAQGVFTAEAAARAIRARLLASSSYVPPALVFVDGLEAGGALGRYIPEAGGGESTHLDPQLASLNADAYFSVVPITFTVARG